mmetsp:Transcript_1283/g.2698  ORF Transcript_1283/g.2698 Transcript_1283/m.2698 type:complete len:314 (+) Transcript_1283:1151-2092(+)
MVAFVISSGWPGSQGFQPWRCRPCQVEPQRQWIKSSAVDDRKGQPRSILTEQLQQWGLQCPVKTGEEFDHAFALHINPLIMCVPNFLNKSECEAIIAMQMAKEGQDGTESDLYLNYRVNQELSTSAPSSSVSSVSTEAASLIHGENLDPSELDAGSKSGFRTQVNPDAEVIQTVILPRIMRLLGMAHTRHAVFEEGVWVRPNARTLLVRDQTTVHYRLGEGVAPHVDGKDATLLIYLTSASSPQAGGATTFPDIPLRVPPVQGMALLYESRGNQLLHYAERVKAGEKWVMQLLLDFRYKPDDIQIDYRTGQLF